MNMQSVACPLAFDHELRPNGGRLNACLIALQLLALASKHATSGTNAYSFIQRGTGIRLK